MTGLPFISAIPGVLDGKGRVCIPAAYRQTLTAQNTPGLYLCPSFTAPVLDAFGQTLLDTTVSRYAGQDAFFSPDFDDDVTTLIARTQNISIDTTGRISLPDAMIEYAGLKDKVMFVGKLQKFQIWDAARYAGFEAEAVARVKAKYDRSRGDVA